MNTQSRTASFEGLPDSKRLLEHLKGFAIEVEKSTVKYENDISYLQAVSTPHPSYSHFWDESQSDVVLYISWLLSKSSLEADKSFLCNYMRTRGYPIDSVYSPEAQRFFGAKKQEMPAVAIAKFYTWKDAPDLYVIQQDVMLTFRTKKEKVCAVGKLHGSLPEGSTEVEPAEFMNSVPESILWTVIEKCMCRMLSPIVSS